jgi:hypothetical protein
VGDTATIQLPPLTEVGPGPRARRDHQWAWWSLLLFLPSLAAAIGLERLLADAYGYGDVAKDASPTWVALAAGYPALILFALPALVTTHFGGLAMRAGVRGAVVPICVAWTLPILFLLQSLLAWGLT